MVLQVAELQETHPERVDDTEQVLLVEDMSASHSPCFALQSSALLALHPDEPEGWCPVQVSEENLTAAKEVAAQAREAVRRACSGGQSRSPDHDPAWAQFPAARRCNWEPLLRASNGSRNRKSHQHVLSTLSLFCHDRRHTGDAGAAGGAAGAGRTAGAAARLRGPHTAADRPRRAVRRPPGPSHPWVQDQGSGVELWHAATRRSAAALF